MSNDLITRRFNDVTISQRSDGYLNATAMCKANRKEWSNYRQNQTAQDFLVELESVLGIPRTELVQTVSGGVATKQGTWVHPQVAYHLAQWCSPAFAVQVTEWIHDIRTKGYATAPGVEIDGLTAKEIGGIIKGIVNKRIEPLESAVKELREVVELQSSHINALMMAADPRVAVVEYVSICQMLDEAGALTKDRRKVQGTIFHEMKTRAALADPPVQLRRSPHGRSKPWLFPVDFAEKYMHDRGQYLVAAHNANVSGQGTLDFPDRRKKPKQQELELVR